MTPRPLRRLLAGLLLIGLAWALVQGGRSSECSAQEPAECAEALADGEDEGGAPLLLVAHPPAGTTWPASVPPCGGWRVVEVPAERPADADREGPHGRAPPGVAAPTV